MTTKEREKGIALENKYFSVPPIRSDFPDSGPFPDFFEGTSPVLVRFLL